MSSWSAVEHAADAPEELRGCLLGSPRVEAREVPLSAQRRQVRALVHRLAAHQEPIPRWRLCVLFWAGTPESEARRDMYLEVLDTLIEDYAARQDYDAAITCARRHLGSDELAEEIARRLIAPSAPAGSRKAAIDQVGRCAVVMERELGVRPLPETRAVCETAVQD